MAPKITAPWTDQQVAQLWERQRHGHAYTCPTHSDFPLSPENDGWHCFAPHCGYYQDWAHESDAIGRSSLVEASRALIEADDIDMNCGWDSPSCHFCLVDTYRDKAPHADDCPWAAFKEAFHDVDQRG